MFFNGYGEYKLDSKKRVTIPSRYRSQIEGDSLILSLTEVCDKPVIAVFPNMEVLSENFQKYIICKNDIFYERNLAIMTNEVKMDTAGRIALGGYLEDDDERSLIICGRIELFEIWHKSDFMDYAKEQNLHIRL